MNEKIKELAEQAGYIPLPGFDFANDLQEVFLKKFAELIAQECQQVSLKNSHRNDDMGAIIAKQIGEHFGIAKGGSMSEVINHEEAYLLACAKGSESNLARCYLDIKAQRDELLEASENVLNDWLKRADCMVPKETLEKVIIAVAKAKGVEE